MQRGIIILACRGGENNNAADRRVDFGLLSYSCLFFVLQLTVVFDQEPDEAVGRRSQRRGGHPGTRVLPAYRLGKNRKPRSAAAVQTENRKYTATAVTIVFTLSTTPAQ